jgi:hypothetical protein
MVVVSRVDTATEAEKTTIETGILKFWSSNDFTTIEVPSILELLDVQGKMDESSDSGSVQLGSEPSSSPPVSAEMLEEAFQRGYSDGFAAAMAVVPPVAPPQEFVLPEGLLGVKESLRIKRALSLQKGGIIAGSLLVSTAAGLAGNGLWQMNSGDTEGSMESLRLAAIISISSLPFFFASLAVRP